MLSQSGPAGGNKNHSVTGLSERIRPQQSTSPMFGSIADRHACPHGCYLATEAIC